MSVTPSVVDVLVVSPGRVWKILALKRANGVTRAGAWEMVHGSIQPGETAHDAAARELREETGLVAERMYNVSAHMFYLRQRATVEVAVVFCAFVKGTPRVTLCEEHARAEWITRAAAAKRFVWPTARETLSRAYALLRTGNAGSVEDVLRVL